MSVYDFINWIWNMAAFGGFLGIIISVLKDWWLKGL